ncbi:MAG: uracil-DNA glycosylase [Alphaproteobacteria bacterium]
MLKNIDKTQLSGSWKTLLEPEFQKEYMQTLDGFLDVEKKAGKIIYPQEDAYFNALKATAFEDVKVVIIGQDPYHGAGQAHGLSFSVCPEMRIPPSLRNIYKEIEGDLNIPAATHGFLENWAEQGVLLLNAVLSVEAGNAGAHQKKGWEVFTDAIITQLNEKRENIVFLLWGSYAQKKGAFIAREKHLVLEAPHPSPLSAHRGFLGCQHFSKTNAYLEEKKIAPIDWSLPVINVHNTAQGNLLF